MKDEKTTEQQLIEAIVDGDSGAIRKIVETTHFDLKDGWLGDKEGLGAGYLHLAASEGQTKVCQTLVELGIDVNATDSDANVVAMDEAATEGHLDTVRWLLDQGACVDGLSSSVATPLMGAAIEGHLEVTRMLLDAGAEVNREHLRLPQTALDFAVIYKMKGSGQDAVATLLLECGGGRPYTEKHNWKGVHGQFYIEHIERAVGGFVNPLVASCVELSKGQLIEIRKVRIPKKYDYQLLFSVGLSSTGFELAICLPSAWPLNQMSLLEPRFNWPVDILNKFGAAQLNGLGLQHGDLLDADNPTFADIKVATEIKQWVVALNENIETEHEEDFRIPRTLLLVPVRTKKIARSGAVGQNLADQKCKAKWNKLSL